MAFPQVMASARLLQMASLVNQHKMGAPALHRSSPSTESALLTGGPRHLIDAYIKLIKMQGLRAVCSPSPHAAVSTAQGPKGADTPEPQGSGSVTRPGIQSQHRPKEPRKLRERPGDAAEQEVSGSPQAKTRRSPRFPQAGHTQTPRADQRAHETWPTVTQRCSMCSC